MNTDVGEAEDDGNDSKTKTKGIGEDEKGENGIQLKMNEMKSVMGLERW